MGRARRRTSRTSCKAPGCRIRRSSSGGPRPRSCGGAASTASSSRCRGARRSTSSSRDGVRGDAYAHELVTLPVGTIGRFLEARRGSRPIRVSKAFDLELVGAFRVAMRNDTEAIVIWAIPDWQAWAHFEQAWDGAGARDRGGRGSVALGADVQRTLLVDAPLEPDAHRPAAGGRGSAPAVGDLVSASLADLLDGTDDDVVAYAGDDRRHARRAAATPRPRSRPSCARAASCRTRDRRAAPERPGRDRGVVRRVGRRQHVRPAEPACARRRARALDRDDRRQRGRHHRRPRGRRARHRHRGRVDAVPRRRSRAGRAACGHAGAGDRPVHVGHHGRAEGRRAAARHGGRAARHRDRIAARRRGSGDRAPMPNLVPMSLSLWAGIYQVLFAFKLGAPVVLMAAVRAAASSHGSCASTASVRPCCRRPRS